MEREKLKESPQSYSYFDHCFPGWLFQQVLDAKAPSVSRATEL